MQYFIHNGKAQKGPFSVDELRNLPPEKNFYIWHEGLEDWKPITEIPEFETLFSTPDEIVILKPPPLITDIQENPKIGDVNENNKPVTEAQTRSVSKKDGKIKWYTYLIWLGIIIVACYVGHPVEYFKHYILPWRTYAINQKCKTNPALTFNSLKTSYSKSYATLTFTNNNQMPDTLILAPPGTNMAFYIFSPDDGVSYPLTDIENANLYPEFNIIQPGDSLTFTLDFNKLEANKFHLIGAVSENRPAKFMNVEINNW